MRDVKCQYENVQSAERIDIRVAHTSSGEDHLAGASAFITAGGHVVWLKELPSSAITCLMQCN